MKRVIVAGGGAAGLMAAIQAAGAGAFVTVLEKQKKPGTKILRTGNGRCNFTNTGDPKGKYHGTDPEFAERVLSLWTPEDTIEFFYGIGVVPYRNGDWIYPHSEQAQSVQKALLLECRKRGVRMKNQEQVVSVRKTKALFQVWTRNWQYEADAVILCCGTHASQKKDYQTGAFSICPAIPARPFHPALCPLLSEGRDSALWAGVRARAAAALCSEGRIVQKESGQIQFTADGISGIPVMNLSSAAWKLLHERKPAEIVLDLVPEMSAADLADYLKMHDCKTEGLVPEKLSRLIRERAHTAKETARLLKEFRIPIRAAGSAEQSQVLGGGFLTAGFDPETMMSRDIPGLYAAGEVLDIDGECGGWNLQFAWAGGAIAGIHAAR